MREVENEKGLFLLEEEMPCRPREIGIGRYFLPATLGRAEQEEAAARILSFSHQLDQWVGVSWPKLVDMMKEDFKKDEAVRKILNRHNERMREWYRQLHSHFWLCIFTLGLYGLFVKKPQRPRDEKEEEVDVPFSIIYTHGPDSIVEGIKELVSRNMLKHIDKEEGENAILVFFPTPALVSRILEVQGIS